MQLNFDNVYSKLVCTACDDQLKKFSILQKDFITKQLKLQKFVSDSEEKLKRKEVDIKSEAEDYASYLNPLVIVKLETEIDSYGISNYGDESKEINHSNTHSSDFKEGTKRTCQMPEIMRKNKGQRKSNDPNK